MTPGSGSIVKLPMVSRLGDCCGQGEEKMKHPALLDVLVLFGTFNARKLWGETISYRVALTSHIVLSSPSHIVHQLMGSTSAKYVLQKWRKVSQHEMGFYLILL
eukprot:g24574.t1